MAFAAGAYQAEGQFRSLKLTIIIIIIMTILCDI